MGFLSFWGAFGVFLGGKKGFLGESLFGVVVGG